MFLRIIDWPSKLQLSALMNGGFLSVIFWPCHDNEYITHSLYATLRVQFSVNYALIANPGSSGVVYSTVITK